MTDVTSPSREELRKRLDDMFDDFGHDVVNETAPRRALNGKLVNAVMSLIDAREAGIRAEAENKLKPDLAWCLGKLRGLGHPNEQMEKRYDLATERLDKQGEKQ